MGKIRVIKLKQILEGKDSKDAAGIAYFFNDMLLSCQSAEGRWGIPKGHIHIDETPEEGAFREFTEETQIILNKPIEFSHKAKKKNGGDFHVFICKGDKQFTPRLNHEHMDWGYFSIHDLPEPFDDRVTKVTEKLSEASITGNIKGVKGATGFIKPSQWNSKKKSLEKSISSSTGYIMVGNKELVKSDDETYRSWKRPAMLKLKPLLERIDYQDTASEIVKSYKLKSKVKITSGRDKGDYEWKSDTINLRPSYSSTKEFLITVLHEIHHALQRKKMGVAKYEREYYKAGEMAVQKGRDFHDDNEFEEEAEEWGKKEHLKWKNKI